VKSKTNRPRVADSTTVRAAGGRRALAGLVLVGLALALPAAVRAQAPASRLPDKTYMTKSAFNLPVIIDDKVRTGLKEIQLYVKEGADGVWACKDKQPPSATAFTYRLTQDGEYWFSVVTLDQAGHMTPADVTREAPGVIVVLDTQGPQIEVHTMPPTADGLMVQCDIQDANPNPFSTRVEYQTGDQVWHAAEPCGEQCGCYCLPKQAVLTGMLKVTSSDRAMNTTVREFNLATLTPAPAAGVQTAKAEDRGESPQVTKSSYMPAATQDVGASAVKVAAAPPLSKEPRDIKIRSTDLVLPDAPAPVDHGPALPRKVEGSEPCHRPEAPAAGCRDDGPALPQKVEPSIAGSNRYLVNNPVVTMEYKVEDESKNGVGKVEVWYTANGGQTWDVLCDDPDRKSPVTFKLPGDGVYGIRLSASNCRGFGAVTPKAGDAPEMVVEVDTTKPVAQLTSVKLGPLEESASVDISWTASDKNFGPTPIELYYSMNPNGPWTPIAKGLRNEGSFRWFLPQGIGKQAFVRLVAVDLAGNSCRCETTEAVALDDNTPAPHVTIGNIVPNSKMVTGPTGN
jgi:hypothetical protein